MTVHSAKQPNRLEVKAVLVTLYGRTYQGRNRLRSADVLKPATRERRKSSQAWAFVLTHDHTDMLTCTCTYVESWIERRKHAVSLQIAGASGVKGVSKAGKATLLQMDIECTFSELPGCSGV